MQRIAYFGARRQLLGTLHTAPRLKSRSSAVLLCSPFGEESLRAHRTFRTLALTLERQRYSVLRFDFSSTGDSLGQATDATIDAWLEDVGVAAEQLVHASGVSRLTVVGLRFGATLASLAASRGLLRPHHLIMWDPVVDGATYLRELAAQHRTYLREEFGSAYQDRLRVRSDGSPTECLGVPIGDDLAAAMARIDLTTTSPGADLVTLVTTRRTPDLDRLRARLPDGVRSIEVAPAGDGETSFFAMVVPSEGIRAIVARIEEVTP